MSQKNLAAGPITRRRGWQPRQPVVLVSQPSIAYDTDDFVSAMLADIKSSVSVLLSGHGSPTATGGYT